MPIELLTRCSTFIGALRDEKDDIFSLSSSMIGVFSRSSLTQEIMMMLMIEWFVSEGGETER